jgi:hypothetical protein
MTFRKPVGSEPFELAGGLFNELDRVAIVDHVLDHLRLELANIVRGLQSCIALAQSVGLAASKSGSDHRDPDGTLLKGGCR